MIFIFYKTCIIITCIILLFLYIISIILSILSIFEILFDYIYSNPSSIILVICPVLSRYPKAKTNFILGKLLFNELK